MAKVLTKAELACLLQVPTTVPMAEMILKRNQAILKMLKSCKSGEVKHGCPHCLEAGGSSEILGDCRACKYPHVDGNPQGHRCCDYSFGGVVFEDVSLIIDLHAHSVDVDMGHPNTESDTAEVWVKGHIEWAREVIRRSRKKGKSR